MFDIRFRIVFILLILILLAASALFGVLTYWLAEEGASDSPSGQGSEIPREYFLDGMSRAWRFPDQALRCADERVLAKGGT